ncbi:MAG: DUF3575 domain-containing protein [Bradymonadales bacterium]|nr:MAG: DUF3575 domain-containing protein [Bradymonadales bacterium]
MNNLAMKFVFLVTVLASSLVSGQDREEQYSTVPVESGRQLVPVGEKHRYSYDYKRWNVWTNPFGYFFGNFNIGGSYAFHQNFKVNASPTFIYFWNSNPNVIGGGLTVSTSIFFKKVYDGFYLEPGAQFLYLSQRRTIGSGTLKGVVGGPQLVAGWGWVWDAGFNLNIGLGLGYYWGDVSNDFEDTEAFDGVFPAGNLQFGYTF